ncbi:hypothetical protein IFR04_009492 [Cadophora malorum]|uniref:Ubiquitin-like domain-containing protein n=1 Tax=Cadophora malorum TaxID=108018 RepID=A0A8H7TEF3_9HELO|nr:hypothetical protein IFR04_009492 [Cadophora malorum]
MIPRPSTNASNHSAGTHHRHHRDLTKHPTKDLKLHVWKSQTRTWTRDQLDEERIAFFDTRTSGREETWQAIRTALEILWAGGDPGAEDNDGGLATAQAILRAAGVTIPSGDLTAAVYDANGARYELPEYIVCDPTNIVEMPTRTEEDEGDKSEEDGETADEAELLRRDEIRRGKAVVNPDDMIDIKVKLSDRDNRPLVVTINKQDTVRIVTKKIYEESGLEPPKHIRIAYLGKILKDNKTLKEQNWEEQNVLNGLVLG